jgi:chromosome segregation ATPase
MSVARMGHLETRILHPTWLRTRFSNTEVAMRRSLRPTVLLLTVLFLARPALAQRAPDPGADGRALRELLDEVRLLRQVLQKTSLVSVRANILLARQQAQQERIGQIERQLSDARNTAREAESQVSQFAEYVAQAEEALTSETDPAKRAEKEEQIRQYNLVRSQVKHSIDTQRERETELTTSLSQEQAKLEQIQRGLDGVEHELEELQKKVPAGGQ